jgi:hypothetical protein
MRIIKLAWSEKRKNKLIDFYAFEPDDKGKVELVTLPTGMASIDEARKVINQDRKAAGKPRYDGRLLDVCFDMSSGLLYLPDMENPSDIAKDTSLSSMLDAVKVFISNNLDPLPYAPVIRGDPTDTLRVRRISDFGYVSSYISKQVGDPEAAKQHLNMPVVEANLSIMSRVFDVLPVFKDNPSLKGIYVTANNVRAVDFVVDDPGGSKNGILLYSQKTTFLLINTSPAAKTSEADKDRIITTYYRDYVASVSAPTRLRDAPEIQELKHLMYIGWSFKELCIYMLRPEKLDDLNSLMVNASFIYNAAKNLAMEGYPDPARTPYYYSFKITDQFPVKFQPQAPGKPFDVSGQGEMLQVIHFDPKTGYVVLKSPLWLSEEVCRKVLNANDTFFCAQYNPHDGAFQCDSSPEQMNGVSPSTLSVIHADVLGSGAKPPPGKPGIPFREKSITEHVFENKNIEDYPHASDIIKKLCKKVSTPEKQVKFENLVVSVGPWMEVMGVAGGYLNKRKFEASGKKPPLVPMPEYPDFKVWPSSILIDSSQMPSVGDRNMVIIHEYQHHINSMLWVESPVLKEKPSGMETAHDVDAWLAYLSSPDERIAHKVQFKYMLGLGMNKQDILKITMGRKPTAANLKIAQKYIEIIDEAAEEMGGDEKDEEDRKNLEKAIDQTVKGTPEEVDHGDDVSEFND